ncbi:MAG: rod shape-determining protein MreC [Bacteroidota bacterium]|nr:rod shape-determining protein MreC [Bacteroidota bacterium]
MRNLIEFFSRYNFVFIFIILEIISIYLLVENNYYQKSSFINSTNAIAAKIYDKTNNINNYFSLRKVNEHLAAENARLHSEVLKSFMKTDIKTFIIKDTVYKQQYEYVSAKVINNTINKRNNYLTLNKGSNSGIKPNMAVISPTGIVGIVKDVTANYSSVISVLNKNFSVKAITKKGNYSGNLVWNGYDYRFAELDLIPSHAKFKIGDSVLTSLSSMFPEGIVVGRIWDSQIKSGDIFYTLKIRLSTDFDNLTYVYVIKNLQKEEQEILEKRSQND